MYCFHNDGWRDDGDPLNDHSQMDRFGLFIYGCSDRNSWDIYHRDKYQLKHIVWIATGDSGASLSLSPALMCAVQSIAASVGGTIGPTNTALVAAVAGKKRKRKRNIFLYHTGHTGGDFAAGSGKQQFSSDVYIHAALLSYRYELIVRYYT